MDLVFFAGIIIAFIVNVFWDEFVAWSPRICKRAVIFAATRLTQEYRKRMVEEWLRHLDDTPGVLGRIGFSVQCIIASQRLMPRQNRIRKRALDITFSLFSIMFLAPLLGIVALIIKLETPGPIMLPSSVVGQGGRLIVIWKFRTTTQASVADDPKLTRFGSFIRAVSIDQLPMIFNVLIGDLSLVGPWIGSYRAVLREESAGAKGNSLNALKPGLSGLRLAGLAKDPYVAAQQYIDRCSLRTDLKILLSTVKVVLQKPSKEAPITDRKG